MCTIVTNMDGKSKGTGNRRKNKIRQNELRQGSNHGNYNILSVKKRARVKKKSPTCFLGAAARRVPRRRLGDAQQHGVSEHEDQS